MKQDTLYRYTKTKLDSNGNIAKEVVEETFTELVDQYWTAWSDTRITMQMSTQKSDFLSDLVVILRLEEVE